MTRTEILERRGIIDSPHLIVEAVKLDIWRVRFSADGTPATAIDASAALKLGQELESIGEKQLAGEIEWAAERATRYAKSGS